MLDAELVRCGSASLDADRWQRRDMFLSGAVVVDMPGYSSSDPRFYSSMAHSILHLAWHKHPDMCFFEVKGSLRFDDVASVAMCETRRGTFRLSDVSSGMVELHPETLRIATESPCVCDGVRYQSAATVITSWAGLFGCSLGKLSLALRLPGPLTTCILEGSWAVIGLPRNQTNHRR